MRKMRKADRQQSSEWALRVFDKAPFATISFVRKDLMPYAVPVSLVRKDDSTFYFHCAEDGEKIDCIRHNPKVLISAVSKCSPKFEEDKNNYTEYYHSAIGRGVAEEVKEREEKILALRLICERFLPKYMDHFDQAIERSLDRTMVIKITLTEPAVGKCKGSAE